MQLQQRPSYADLKPGPGYTQTSCTILFVREARSCISVPSVSFRVLPCPSVSFRGCIFTLTRNSDDRHQTGPGARPGRSLISRPIGEIGLKRPGINAAKCRVLRTRTDQRHVLAALLLSRLQDPGTPVLSQHIEPGLRRKILERSITLQRPSGNVPARCDRLVTRSRIAGRNRAGISAGWLSGSKEPRRSHLPAGFLGCLMPVQLPAGIRRSLTSDGTS